MRAVVDEHVKMVSLKTSKTLGLFRKLHNLLPQFTLITIHKAFVRPYLDCGDILYDQAYNMSFHHKLESIQYNACLAITGAVQGTSKEKLYLELGLETLKIQGWYGKLGMFYKIYKKATNIFLKQYLKKPMRMLHEMLITFPVLKLDTASSKTLSFLLQSLNTTI